MNAPAQIETGPTGRIYVTAREVAAVCKLSEYFIDLHLRPDAWGSPHDFKINASGVMLYALESLPQLADEIELRGGLGTATALRAWTVTQIEAALRRPISPTDWAQKNQTLGPVAPRSDRAPWLNQWERTHEG